MIHIDLTFSAWFLVIPAIIVTFIVGWLLSGEGEDW